MTTNGWVALALVLALGCGEEREAAEAPPRTEAEATSPSPQLPRPVAEPSGPRGERGLPAPEPTVAEPAECPTARPYALGVESAAGTVLVDRCLRREDLPIVEELVNDGRRVQVRVLAEERISAQTDWEPVVVEVSSGGERLERRGAAGPSSCFELAPGDDTAGLRIRFGVGGDGFGPRASCAGVDHPFGVPPADRRGSTPAGDREVVSQSATLRGQEGRSLFGTDSDLREAFGADEDGSGARRGLGLGLGDLEPRAPSSADLEPGGERTGSDRR